MSARVDAASPFAVALDWPLDCDRCTLATGSCSGCETCDQHGGSFCGECDFGVVWERACDACGYIMGAADTPYRDVDRILCAECLLGSDAE